MTTAKQGDTVVIDFTVKKKNGALVGSTESAGGPQTLTLGDEQIFPTIDAALTGMSVGEEKTVELSCENGFGPRRAELIMDIPRDKLPAEQAPEVGMSLAAKGQSGEVHSFVIIDVAEDKVTADGNHPLAGEDLVFNVKLLEVKAAA
ncbi:FKBP-type peptidyl-prolyl cis-trans isomerase [Sphingomicrobium aestuariivivum]|uniref:FKBP-type peptidyl-prolyl cis-trans isomerase n=1 Tax=Sphingomicrobium aestuariivivum TaxID=1582356 RepID=UPI001FD66B08|nr:peptidylprolyl isomerase [Sphingomicrobium aestuariivivum]MCJ8190047.1 peptidylprolyl isomerase [Sphingomicrobium aestuariivivum]